MSDAGDEAADALLRELKQFLEREASGLSGDMVDAIAEFFGSLKRHASDGQDDLRLDDRAGAIEPDIEADLEQIAGSATGTPCVVAYCEDLEAAEFLSTELTKAGVDNCFSPEDVDLSEEARSHLEPMKGESGLYEIYIPDREPALSIHMPFSKIDHAIVGSAQGYTLWRDAGEELHALVAMFSAERTAKRLATQAACVEAALEVEKASFAVGNPDNLKIAFRTVEWDRDASILTGNLKELGIGYDVQRLSEGKVSIEVAEEHASAVKQLADHAIESWGIDKKRFENYDEIERRAQEISARDEYMTARLSDPDAYNRVKAALDEQGIAYDARLTADGKESVITVARKELAAKGFDMERAAKQASRNDAKSRLPKERSRKAPSTPVETKRHTPEQDEIVAKRAARAHTAAQRKTRTRSR